MVWVPVKSDDAVRAAVVLAEAWPSAYVKADALAEREQLPLRFLENILADLRRAEIVHARRGACGGYMLARSPADISVAAVLGAVGSPLVVEPDAYKSDRVRAIWNRASAAATRVFAECSLADLLGDGAQVVTRAGGSASTARRRRAVATK